ncbi:hypothetical protein QYE76_028741 [Lolium multiflorum]|uniref:Protein EXORDIUM-like 2 n=1 Tax=Lolium multiflorum TaxID=4521 RepID=A0AAD8QQ41_LOLMU|nr:hypothetical protein QYE76_028741 [Lolium multiflorum]
MDESKRTSFVPLLCLFFLLVAAAAPGCAAYNPRMLFLVKPDPIVLQDHHGTLLTGNLTVNILYYGRFAPAQRAIVADFVRSVSAPATRAAQAGPSVASWWRVTSQYRGGGARLILGRQLLDERMSLGRSLSLENVTALAKAAGHHRGAITAVLTAPDVLVDPFCMFRCGVHDHASAGAHGRARYTYLWAGNPAKQCPGQCAWPFARPVYGPPMPPLVSPSGDVGMDGVVISLAALLAGTVTNPYGDGYYQGDLGMEAATACTGIFGSGAYPGYPGTLLKDHATGASYNAVGLGGRKYLLPALWDPTTSKCRTLV